MAMRVEEGWIYCFDPYYRTRVRGLRPYVRLRLELTNVMHHGSQLEFPFMR